ncbi:MAG: hypothetical protein CMM25_05725 [Rhodospirillaceae bacterium]|nr:hypothetical protein [Rhodospirillaceae bacterium]
MIPQLIFEILLPYLMNPIILGIVVTLVFLFYNGFIKPGPTLYKALPFLENPDDKKEEPTPAPAPAKQQAASPLNLDVMSAADALEEILKPPDERKPTSQEMQAAAMQEISTADLQKAINAPLNMTPTVTPVPGTPPPMPDMGGTPIPVPIPPSENDLPMPPNGITGVEENYAPAVPTTTTKKVSFRKKSKSAF